MNATRQIIFRGDMVGDRRVVSVDPVHGWPDIVHFAKPWVEADNQDRDIMQVDGDTLTITVANGRAVYRRIGDTQHGDWICSKVESEIAGQPKPEAMPLRKGFERKAG